MGKHSQHGNILTWNDIDNNIYIYTYYYTTTILTWNDIDNILTWNDIDNNIYIYIPTTTLRLY